MPRIYPMAILVLMLCCSCGRELKRIDCSIGKLNFYLGEDSVDLFKKFPKLHLQDKDAAPYSDNVQIYTLSRDSANNIYGGLDFYKGKLVRAGLYCISGTSEPASVMVDQKKIIIDSIPMNTRYSFPEKDFSGYYSVENLNGVRTVILYIEYPDTPGILERNRLY